MDFLPTGVIVFVVLCQIGPKQEALLGLWRVKGLNAKHMYRFYMLFTVIDNVTLESAQNVCFRK
jgi:predicted cation transporter